MIIDPGKLNRRVMLRSPTNTRGSNGENIVSYADAGQRWASFLALLPAEAERTQVAGSKATSKLVMYLDSLTSQIGVRWQIIVDGITWNVIGTEPTPADGSLMVFIAGVQA